ncbi:MAG TPA: DUF2281 domain-containing protein [Candidatus Riflebacteria bacterium]|jgi:hypothetical protein|nr:MAG: DUF2281 domain-containing protein [Candidatus Riflebacteria bacterium HGW-Riflebacteria-1]HAE40268.1 DUF2281 domain-containing protein [Candidatus Riflebacteria bacterium]
MTRRSELLKEIETVPEPLLAEVIDFVKFLKMKAVKEANYDAVASESTLKKDWLKVEEDKAWKDL